MRFLAKISFFGAFQGPNQGPSCKGFFYMKHRLVTTVLKAKQRTGVGAERMAKYIWFEHRWYVHPYD